MSLLFDLFLEWMRWALYSWVRVVFIVVGGVALIITIAVVSAQVDDQDDSPAVAETTSPSAETSQTSSTGTTPLSAEDKENSKEHAAEFVEAWAARPKGKNAQAEWFKAVKPLCTPDLAEKLKWVDPRQSETYVIDKKTEITNTHDWEDGRIIWGVPTDKGVVQVALVKAENGWRVDGVQTGVDAQ